MSSTEDQGATAVQEPAAAAQEQPAGEGPTGEGSAPERAQARPSRLPNSLTFQITRTTMLLVFAVFLCITPIALAEPLPYFVPVYVVPAALAFALLRPRTVVDRERVRARMFFGETAFGWDELASVRLDARRWVRAVLHSGQEVRLPAVRVRNLPHLALLSGGRLPDPSAVADTGDSGEAAETGDGAAAGAEGTGETAETAGSAGTGTAEDSAAAEAAGTSGAGSATAEPAASTPDATAATATGTGAETPAAERDSGSGADHSTTADQEKPGADGESGRTADGDADASGTERGDGSPGTPRA